MRSDERKRASHRMWVAMMFLLVFGFYFNSQARAMEPDHDTNKLSADSPRTKAAASEIYNEITPQVFGASGDGITDDTEAFQKLTDYCNSHPGVYVSIPTGHYIISQPLTFTENVTIRGNGPDSLLDFSRITNSNGTALLITGNYRELERTRSPQEAGRNTLVYHKASELSSGDIVAILDPTGFSWSNEREYYRKGEFCEIHSLASSRANLTHFLCDSYDKGCELLLMDMVKCEVTGLSILVFDRGPQIGMVPLELRYAKDSLISDVTAGGSNYEQIELKSCYNVLLDHICAEYVCKDNFGLNYGVVVANSQYIEIRNSVFSALRHGVAIGGSSSGAYVINRYVTISDSSINSIDTTSADIHGNSQYIKYDRCRIFNGINMGGSDITVHNCDVSSGNTAAWIIARHLVNGNLDISGNHFYAMNADSVNRSDNLALIALLPNEFTSKNGVIRLDSNVFERGGEKTIRISGEGCRNTCTVLMTDNVIKGGLIAFENISDIVFDHNYLNGRCVFSSDKDLEVSSTRSIIFSNNTLQNLEKNGIEISIPAQHTAAVNVSGNTFSNIGGTAIWIVQSDTLIAEISGNTYISCGAESNVE